MSTSTLLSVISLICLFPLMATHQPDPCNYDFVTLVWMADKVYPQSPFISNDTLLMQAVGLTPVELEALRQDSLAWFDHQFGLPVNTSIYDPVTGLTVIPGYGIMVSTLFEECYRLTGSSGHAASVDRRKVFLRVAEYVFLAVSPSPNATYGGRFGELCDATGFSRSVVDMDSYAYGYYYIYENKRHHEKLQKRVLFKGKFPTKTDLPFRLNEELYLEDEDWGNGTSVLRIEMWPLQNSSTWIQITGTWKFPEISDIYSVLGL